MQKFQYMYMLAIKRWFSFNYAKFLQGRHFAVGGPKNFFWERLSKYCVVTFTPSDNETPPISRVLIGRHLIFCWLTSLQYCNLPRECTPVKYKKRQKVWVSNCHMSTLSSLLLFSYARPMSRLISWYNNHVI